MLVYNNNRVIITVYCCVHQHGRHTLGHLNPWRLSANQEYAEFIKMAAARVNLESSTRTRHIRTGQNIYIYIYIRRVLCLDSMPLKTRSRLNTRGRHIYEFAVYAVFCCVCIALVPL